MATRYSTGMRYILTSLLSHEPQKASGFGGGPYSQWRAHSLNGIEPHERKVAARNARRAVYSLRDRGDLTATAERDWDCALPHAHSSWPIWCSLTNQGREQAAIFKRAEELVEEKRIAAMTPDERANEMERRAALKALSDRLATRGRLPPDRITPALGMLG
jgi:delta 1-pyrroline-5-carboxylate dehydrogenase